MPRIVDSDERRRRIADALIRVAVRDGVAAASVRTVGAEAGMSAGALRHYFTSQDDLLRFALDRLDADVRSRVARLEADGDPLERALALLGLLLPLDDGRLAACRIWFEVTVLARSRPALTDAWAGTWRGTAEACAAAVALVAPDLPPAEREPELRRLHAMLDGVALHGCYADVPAADQLEVVRRHLIRLRERSARSPAAGPARAAGRPRLPAR